MQVVYNIGQVFFERHTVLDYHVISGGITCWLWFMCTVDTVN